MTLHRDGRGFEIEVPTAWELLIDPRADVALAALEPEPDPWGFRSNVLVTLDDLDRGMTLRAWQEGAEKLMPAVLTDYLLLDREDIHVGERAGVRRLAHQAADGRAVTMEQWATIDGRRGYTLTASVSTLAYPTLADQVAAIAATFRVGRPAASSGHRP